jgi:hypothetical protein
MAGLPDWVEKHKAPGIAIERRGTHYYASRVTSTWDPEKKRARKVTLEYLGKVTPDGILPPKHKRVQEVEALVDSGNIRLLHHFGRGLEKALKKRYAGSWQNLMTMAVLRLAYSCRLKDLQLHHRTSLSHAFWPEARLSKNTLTAFLRNLGREYGTMQGFFQDLCEEDGSYMALDLSHAFSDSHNIDWLEKGYNGKEAWHDQIVLALIWSLSHHRPGYLRLLPGSIPSAPSLRQTLVESGLRNVVLVGDRGFYSTANVAALEKEDVEYVLALPRDKVARPHPPHSKYKEYFVTKGQAQWWFEERLEDGRRLLFFLDKEILAAEENALLRKVVAKEETKSTHRERRHELGVLAVLTNTILTPEQVLELYRERVEIEVAFDALKNTLEGDKSWMQSRQSLQGYYFILFLALYLWSQIRDHLKRKDLLGKYSVGDVLMQLGKVHEVTVGATTTVAPVPKQVRKLVHALELPITKILGS